MNMVTKNNTYVGTFSISFRVQAIDEETAADELYEVLNDRILNGISAAAFALHDEIVLIYKGENNE
jgi:hypothetical protein